MNDFRDLKAIAEACQQHQPLRFMRSHGALYIRNDNGIVFDVHQNRSFPEFMAQNKDYADLVLAAKPATILALIAENERVKARLCVCRDCSGQGETYSGHDSYQGHFQPPEPDMDVCGTCGGDGVLGPLEDFEALAAERDQLRAEVAGLRTGYQAYERVNAELKAEVEKIDSDRKACWAEFKVQGRRLDELKADNDALRQDADRLRWLRQHEFDIGSYHGVHEHNATAWFEHISDSDIDSMIADEAQFAKEAGHE